MRASLLLAFLTLALPLGAQQIEVDVTLSEAEEAALAGNPTLRAARSRAEAAAGMERGAAAFRWPVIQASLGAMRSDDPVAVFGAKLRQDRFGASDLELARLNNPAPVADWSARVAVRWEIGTPSRWADLAATRAGALTAEAGAEHLEEATRLQARVLFYEALRTNARLSAADVTVEAARALAARVGARRDEGMATEADALQAEAALEAAVAVRAGMSAEAANAADALGAHLGWPQERIPRPLEPSGEPPVVTDADRDGLADRADLRASGARVAGARDQLRAAAARRWPRVAAFGGLSTHTATLSDGPAPHWTIGVELSVPVFSGFALSSASDVARSQLQAAEAQHEARSRAAEAEAAAAARAVEAGRAALTSADRASEAATEAARLLRRRYDEGMATIAEALLAESVAAQMAAVRIDAEASLRVALATLDFVSGPSSPVAGNPEGEDL